MRRVALRHKSAPVSLFPFLAVLICTMGALIVLLVVMVRQARVQADVIAAQQDADRQRQQAALDDERLAEEEHTWRLEVLQEQRQQIAADLERRRLALSHLEDHERRLREQLKQLMAAADQLEQSRQSPDLDSAALLAERERLQAVIAALQTELADLERRTKEQQRSFALVPYDGPNGTRRRPIYIECTSEHVILQPEGVVLRPSDFGPPLGAGNPLDAALRAIREYWQATGALRGSEPYPLLVVRPGGSISYGAARTAMTSWDDQFGYELLENEVRLSYPPADPRLAELVEQTIAEARRRQELMRSAAPGRFGGQELLSFAAPAYREAGGGLGGWGDDGAGSATGGGGRTAGGGTIGANGNAGAGTGGGGERPGGGGNGPTAAAGRRGGFYGDGSAEGQGQAGTTGQGTGGGRQGGASPGSASPGSAGGGAGAPGEPQGQPATQLARARGANWAVPNAAEGSTPFTRPIRIGVLPDRLILYPERGDDQHPVIVAMPGATRGAVDEFVSAIWRRVDSWGIAGRRAYWKPVLRAEVAPGADGRYADLETLLDRSGLVLERKSP